ncbi:sigma-E factor negative regulatory protein [Pararobbsia silviterrae]|uniref:Anti-sigma factor n=1 Tax=Pararobbsia silviterrae TaxID=1792498 RepID=A0A494Y4M3_9BURK|nr:RseA family anti-sigma factor [Pararobbsia silviterrae]RKP56453.1 anti-sigma factor [Pararobbsia silviterrae]
MGSVSSHTQADSRAERVSALVDNQSLGDVDQFMFELDADDRATWSAYHLVGDVLRSDDLAHGAAETDGFMARFSARLADEPHLLAPAPHARPSQPDAAHGAGAAEPAAANGVATFGARRRVAPAFAIAAAAAVLSWVVLPQLQHLGNPSAAGLSPAALSAATVTAPDVRQVSVAMSPAPSVSAQPSAAQPNVIRDAALDQYLEAHMEFASHPGDNGAPYVRSALYSTGAN